jgi:hypothetical protein
LHYTIGAPPLLMVPILQGFWLTLVALILLLLGGCTVCFGRRKDRMGGVPSYPMKSTGGGFFSKFRRN